MAVTISVIPANLDLTNTLPSENVESVTQISLPDFPDFNANVEHFHKLTINHPVDEEVTYLNDIINQVKHQHPDLLVLDYRVFIGNEQYIKQFNGLGFNVLLYVVRGTELDLTLLV